MRHVTSTDAVFFVTTVLDFGFFVVGMPLVYVHWCAGAQLAFGFRDGARGSVPTIGTRG